MKKIIKYVSWSYATKYAHIHSLANLLLLIVCGWAYVHLMNHQHHPTFVENFGYPLLTIIFIWYGVTWVKEWNIGIKKEKQFNKEKEELEKRNHEMFSE